MKEQVRDIFKKTTKSEALERIAKLNLSREELIDILHEIKKEERESFLSKMHKKTPCSAEGRREMNCAINLFLGFLYTF